MAPRGPSVEIEDFAGGLNSYDPEYLSPLDQSPDLDNVVVLDKGLKKRNGDSVWNSTAMVSSSTPIVGAGYIQYDNATQQLNAVAGTRFFVDSGLSGTMTDETGAITITSGASNYWTPVNFNNLQIWFGGNPDAPFKYSGSGNAAPLGGSPPSAYTAFAGNNRIFGVGTAANPSRIFWPVISNPEDWTSAGSGTADVAVSDGEALQFGVVMGPDTAILFKNSSTHMMVLTRQPFPIYQLQKGIGAAGRYAYAYAHGVLYFVTPGRRMMSTTGAVYYSQSGSVFDTYPNNINDIWDSINVNRVSNIVGYYYQAREWIVWLVSTGSNTTNNYAIIWDIKHKCFLRCTTGFKANVACLVQNRRFFAGHYDGKLYEKDKATIFADASETSPGAINGYWRSPFNNMGGLDATIDPLYFTVSALNESSTVLNLSYGFDYTSIQRTQSSSIVAVGAEWDVDFWDVGVWGGQNAVQPRMYVNGRGNLFSLTIGNAVASQGFTIQGVSIRLRTDKARKELTAV